MADFGSADLLEDALSVIEAAGLERVVPVALSHAGWVAIELQRRLGVERVPGIVSLDWMVLGPPPPFMGALAGLQDHAQWEQVRGALFEMWTTGVASTAVHAFVDRMGQYGFDMWSRAGREIAADFAPTTVAGRRRAAENPAPFPAHLRPTDRRRLPGGTAGLRRAAPMVRVERGAGRSHFPNIEAPTETAAAIESFVNGL